MAEVTAVPGGYVRDERLNRSGIVTDVLGELVQIRPVPRVEGYRTWIAQRAVLCAVTEADRTAMDMDEADTSRRMQEAQ